MSEHVEIVIERMVHGGNGLARLHDGRIVLVRGGLPGERVTARIESRKGVLFGEVSEVSEPSPDRVPPPEHPGLDYGHIRYERQLELKREVVRDALDRALRRAVDVPPVTAAPNRWAYRAAVQPAVTAGGLGYRRHGSRAVVRLDTDPTAVPSVVKAWRTLVDLEGHRHGGLREVAIRGTDPGDDALIALVGTGGAAGYLDLAHRLVAAGIAGVTFAPFDPRGRFRGGAERLVGKRWLLQAYGDLELTIGATSFAQPNPAAATELYRELVEWAGTGSHAVELFAGGGAIALNLAQRFTNVTATEVDRSAVARGRRDAERLGIDNVTFTRADARDVELPGDADLLVVDPPRAGLAAPLRDELARTLTAPGRDEPAATRLVYVSCDVATWARDVADLDARGLELVRFQPFDFYPHTHHIEVLSLLAPRGQPRRNESWGSQVEQPVPSLDGAGAEEHGVA